jgi:hypothetical protein
MKMEIEKTESNPEEIIYNKEYLEKTIKEKRNWKAAKEAAEAIADQIKREKEELERRLKDLEEKNLVEKENFKELYERAKAMAEKESLEKASIQNKWINGIKVGQLKTELSKQGIRPERLDTVLKLTDINKLKYNEEHNVVLGVEEEARLIKEQYSEFFGKQIPSVSHEAPHQNSTITINSIEDFRKLKPEERTQEVLMELGRKLGVDLRK